MKESDSMQVKGNASIIGVGSGGGGGGKGGDMQVKGNSSSEGE